MLVSWTLLHHSDFFHHDYLCIIFVLSRLYFICCTYIQVKLLVRHFCGRLRKISRKILVKLINCYVQCENSVTFFHFRISQGSVATLQVRWKSLKELSYESIGERILKIGPHLPKLSSNIKGYTFLRHSVVYQCIDSWTLWDIIIKFLLKQDMVNSSYKLENGCFLIRCTAACGWWLNVSAVLVHS